MKMMHTYERSARTLIHASNFLIFAKPNVSFLNALRITLEGTVVSVFLLTLRGTLKMPFTPRAVDARGKMVWQGSVEGVPG